MCIYLTSPRTVCRYACIYAGSSPTTVLHAVLGESMPGAGDKVEELGGGVQEVEYLRDEEEQKSLAKVAQDTDHCKRHASKVAISVSYKHL